MKVEQFDPSQLIEYLNKSIKNELKIQSQKAWIIRYAFMLKFGLNDTSLDEYIEPLNYLIERNAIEITLGYEPKILDKGLTPIATLKQFLDYYKQLNNDTTKTNI